jgi:hypothetical protein
VHDGGNPHIRGTESRAPPWSGLAHERRAQAMLKKGIKAFGTSAEYSDIVDLFYENADSLEMNDLPEPTTQS